MSPLAPDQLARAAHPRLAVLVWLGAAVCLLGLLVLVLGPALGVGARRLGLQLAVVGTIGFLAGGSGYVAFGVFEAGFE